MGARNLALANVIALLESLASSQDEQGNVKIIEKLKYAVEQNYKDFDKQKFLVEVANSTKMLDMISVVM